VLFLRCHVPFSLSPQSIHYSLSLAYYSPLSPSLSSLLAAAAPTAPAAAGEEQAGHAAASFGCPLASVCSVGACASCGGPAPGSVGAGVLLLEEACWFGVAGTLVCDLTGFGGRGLGFEARASVAVGRRDFGADSEVPWTGRPIWWRSCREAS
jgi:hypothetical protein